jgi:hypothetical protein
MLNRLDSGGFDNCLGTLGRARSVALEQLFTIHSISCDLRWALIELAVRSIAAMLTVAGRRAASLGRHLAKRARLATYFTPAATMVAAGGR